MPMVLLNGTNLTLEEFLGSPSADEEPSWEYLADGRLVRKVSPSLEHGVLQFHIARLFAAFIERAGASIHVLPEVRLILARTSPVPDISLYRGPFRLDAEGHLPKYPPGPPLVAIEIQSPGQSRRSLMEKCADTVAQGASLGLIVAPREREVVSVTVSGQTTYRGAEMIPLDVIPELAGVQLTPDAIFACLP